MGNQPNNQSERLITRKDLSGRWSLSIKSLKRREKAGLLRPLTLSSNTVRYRLSDILAIEEDATPKL